MEGEETQRRGRPIVLETGTAKNEKRTQQKTHVAQSQIPEDLRLSSQGTRTWLLDSLLMSQAMEENRREHSIHLPTSYNM